MLTEKFAAYEAYRKSTDEDEKKEALVTLYNIPKLELNFSTDGLLIAFQNFLDFHDGYKPI
eukprot:CAMPEP_0116915450 /NCGR_PEP_ID=MMETSP0467-20121206/17935_1 /TAXON_ID=283647 /ORGANISM="Mesodinium pulex, Strain SPMC105" /LENGTH=60 /DNA_ID=CAMNT_0004592115 /DNA_START=1204 /DNA_END=1386 /DNA_ORIENTATION=+